MAAPLIEMVLTVLLVTAFATRATAQSSCSNVITGMAPCLTYITGNSSTPSSPCCSQLTNALQSQPECLCSILTTGAGAALGLAINRTLALALPSACSVPTPSTDQCNAANGPANSPVGSLSPADSPTNTSNATPDSPITPTSTSSPAGNGSKSTPTKGGDTSDGNMTNLGSLSHILFLFVVSCTSVLTSF